MTPCSVKHHISGASCCLPEGHDWVHDSTYQLVPADDSDTEKQLVVATEAARRQALEDAKAGIESAADRRPALMNPDTMRHIASNVGLWADHQAILRAAPRPQGEEPPAGSSAPRYGK